MGENSLVFEQDFNNVTMQFGLKTEMGKGFSVGLRVEVERGKMTVGEGIVAMFGRRPLVPSLRVTNHINR